MVSKHVCKLFDAPPFKTWTVTPSPWIWAELSDSPLVNKGGGSEAMWLLRLDRQKEDAASTWRSLCQDDHPVGRHPPSWRHSSSLGEMHAWCGTEASRQQPEPLCRLCELTSVQVGSPAIQLIGPLQSWLFDSSLMREPEPEPLREAAHKSLPHRKLREIISVYDCFNPESFGGNVFHKRG